MPHSSGNTGADAPTRGTHAWLRRWNALGGPYPPHLRAVARRSAWLWLLCRLLGFILLWPTAGLAVALHPNAATRVMLIALTAFLAWLDRTLSHERLLPANLGAHPAWFGATSIAVATLLDGAVQALLDAL